MRTLMPSGWIRSIFMATLCLPSQVFGGAEDAATIAAIAIEQSAIDSYSPISMSMMLANEMPVQL